jgi:Fe-S cluster assembly iron-binding protein IscA
MIYITQLAVAKLQALIEEHPEDPIVRLAIRDRDDQTLIFSITLEDAVTQEDSVLDIEGLIIAIDGSYASRMEGVTVDYDDQAGFRFHHPEPPDSFTLNLIQPE